MPPYEFVCDTCGARFEQARSFGDYHAAVCPNGHGRTHKVFSVPAIVFRGSGWYVNDSRGKKPAQSGE
jgi:putative FmdB family regulatory protein